eukprot:PhM_4_TR13195/c0_g3_i1/m.24846
MCQQQPHSQNNSSIVYKARRRHNRRLSQTVGGSSSAHFETYHQRRLRLHGVLPSLLHVRRSRVTYSQRYPSAWLDWVERLAGPRFLLVMPSRTIVTLALTLPALGITALSLYGMEKYITGVSTNTLHVPFSGAATEEQFNLNRNEMQKRLQRYALTGAGIGAITSAGMG